MFVLLVVDMQVGLFRAVSRYDAEGVVQRINRLSEAVRAGGGEVIFVQHDGLRGEFMEPGSEDWEILPSLVREDDEIVVRKQACDAFYKTELQDILEQRDARLLIVTGCATDFCVDTTIRAAVSHDFEIIVVEDGHTTADRPHLEAESIIRHHNWMWAGLIHPRIQVEVLPTQDILDQLSSGEIS